MLPIRRGSSLRRCGVLCRGESVGRRQILLAREQESYVDGMPAKMASSMAGALLRAGNLDKQVRLPAAGVELRAAAQLLAVSWQQRRDSKHTHPSTPLFGRVRDKQNCRARYVLERDFEEKSLARFALMQLLAYRAVIGGTVLDGVVERWSDST